ncbi:hypothetical protein L2E82_01013 [Cichorium intybus]|uniref:Uncharacterized protein n=1 Tax=Cichorium intybus TaxID=13427 RepID=A0ACB9GYU5_CICIN|nr:hypothetical protein L2E82_01013 [Cichorium intybus]
MTHSQATAVSDSSTPDSATKSQIAVTHDAHIRHQTSTTLIGEDWLDVSSEVKERRQRSVGVTGRDFIKCFKVGDVDRSHRPICRSIPPVEVEKASFEEFDRPQMGGEKHGGDVDERRLINTLNIRVS